MSKLILLILFVASLSTYALPKNVLWGDWESAGNDVIPAMPAYLPSYPYSYDCQIEIEGEPLESGRYFLVTRFTFDNQASDWYIGDDFEWNVYRQNEDDGSLEKTSKKAKDIFLSPSDIAFSLGFLERASASSPDRILTYFSLKMGVGQHWISDNESRLFDRDDARLGLRVSLGAEPSEDGVSALRREAQVICRKTK